MVELLYPSAVREMPEEDRPRERLERLGPEALRDAELIAVLFRTGTREMGAVALADAVMRHFGNLRAVARASIEQLMEVKGLGRVKAIEIKAALELGRRLVAHTDKDRRRIRNAEDVSSLLMAQFKECETEQFKCLLLNTKNDVVKIVDVASGSLDHVEAVPRDVFRQAVRDGVARVIVCHNHPSGDPEPSRDDLAITKRLVESGHMLGVSLLDHVIFGDGRYVSLAERNLL
ncbi:MAG TPA: DNA repair protein RadC [Candidatus Hydrogenedentes bacterium]|nr:DNA repair protein RadC [Candidatus Hydrogenedentota bacterium]HPC17457.1 DNA repair protein RadC [Candidatus Hydrogenedentota bacterium]HRT20049.1 DNA repair protein RadC [Candidatus Hydrogenedentota bacterium]HRT64887.1 DNA repair protein RadC [Candidatus Hydrogenedentota bacterium]